MSKKAKKEKRERMGLTKREGSGIIDKRSKRERSTKKVRRGSEQEREPESNQNSTIPFLEETVKKKKLR